MGLFSLLNQSPAQKKAAADSALKTALAKATDTKKPITQDEYRAEIKKLEAWKASKSPIMQAMVANQQKIVDAYKTSYTSGPEYKAAMTKQNAQALPAAMENLIPGFSNLGDQSKAAWITSVSAQAKKMGFDIGVGTATNEWGSNGIDAKKLSTLLTNPPTGFSASALKSSARNQFTSVDASFTDQRKDNKERFDKNIKGAITGVVAAATLGTLALGGAGGAGAGGAAAETASATAGAGYGGFGASAVGAPLVTSSGAVAGTGTAGYVSATGGAGLIEQGYNAVKDKVIEKAKDKGKDLIKSTTGYDVNKGFGENVKDLALAGGVNTLNTMQQSQAGNEELQRQYEQYKEDAKRQEGYNLTDVATGKQRLNQDYATRQDELRRSQHLQNVQNVEALTQRGIYKGGQSSIGESQTGNLQADQQAENKFYKTQYDRNLQDANTSAQRTKEGYTAGVNQAYDNKEQQQVGWNDIIKTNLTPTYGEVARDVLDKIF